MDEYVGAKRGDVIVITQDVGGGDYVVGEIVTVTYVRGDLVFGNKYGAIGISHNEYEIDKVNGGGQ